MNTLTEWLAAIAIVLVVVFTFMLGGVLISALFIAIVVGLVIAATLDIIGGIGEWFKSRFK